MYQQYFGLQQEPFSIAVNPRFLYMSERHREALAHLLYGVSEGGGIILLTGEVGTGKTTITRCLLKQLPATTDVALVLNPALSAEELLAAVCHELGIAVQGSENSLKYLSDRLHHFLLANYERGRNTILLIDEAQHLKPEVLEHIRLLTNLETETRKLLKIILVGQPELRDILAKPHLRQVAQRITAKYQLDALNQRETAAYIRHRLTTAGLPANVELFPPVVVASIYRASGGVPRLINILCDRMLLGTYGQDKPRVDRALARHAIREVLGEEQPGVRYGSRLLSAASAVLALVLLCGILLWWRVQAPVADASLGPPEAAEVVEAAARPVHDRTPETATSDEPRRWFDTKAQALDALLVALNYQVADGHSSCEEIEAAGLRCESGRAQVWGELLTFNRPAVIELVTPERFSVYAALLGVRGNQAVLVSAAGTVESPLASLGPLWSGDFMFLWNPPPEYQKPIGPGQSGPAVKWLAEQFALLDGEQSALSDWAFNDALAERVRIFQRDKGLAVDGVAGMLTLLALNETLGRDATLGDSIVLTAGGG